MAPSNTKTEAKTDAETKTTGYKDRATQYSNPSSSQEGRILAVDQGTTGTTCMVFEPSAEGLRPIARGYAELPQHFPQPAHVEHDLEEIWQSVLSSLHAALAQMQAQESLSSPPPIVGIGITSQRETVGIWSSKGAPLGRALVWQDRRTAPICTRLKEADLEEMFLTRTGLVLDPYFSGTKWSFWMQNDAENGGVLRAHAQAGTLRTGTIDTWLLWRLTGGRSFATDATNASRTLAFDIHRQCWDDELLGHLGLETWPKTTFAKVMDSAGIAGHTLGVAGLPDGIPIAGMAGDQHAALFGQGCFEPGMAKCTYGTGAFLLRTLGKTAKRAAPGLLTTLAWRLEGVPTYALEGSVFVAGAAVQWLRDGLGFIPSSDAVEALARTVPSSDGVLMVPALTGMGAPHWRPEARGLIAGLSRRSQKGHIARATLEGIAFCVADLFDAMQERAGDRSISLRVDGGACANNLLMQFQADLLDLPLLRPKVLDTTALGAAKLAQVGLGHATLESLNRSETSGAETEAVFQPKSDSKISESLKTHRARWQAMAAVA